MLVKESLYSTDVSKKKSKKHKLDKNSCEEHIVKIRNEISNFLDRDASLNDAAQTVIKKKHKKQKQNHLESGEDNVQAENENTIEIKTSECIKKKRKKSHHNHNDKFESTQFSAYGLYKNHSSDDKKNISESDNQVTHKKKCKKRKHQKNVEGDEQKSHDSDLNEMDELAKKKKKKKKIKHDEQEYKPGMLSSILYKKKYGVDLPVVLSFGKESKSFQEEGDKNPNIKMSPLFNPSSKSKEKHEQYKVFVGNLPHGINSEKLRKIFKSCGEIHIIRIKGEQIKKKFRERNLDKEKDSCNKQNTKYALISFNSLENCKAAIKMNGRLYDEHHLKIRMCSDLSNSTDLPNIETEKSVFVGNLSNDVTDDDLWKVFEACGEIDSVRVLRNSLNKKGTCGYVNFKMADSVEKALILNGTLLLNRNIRVDRFRRNARSLSNSITVKRRKIKKKVKPQQDLIKGEGDKNFASKIVKISKKISTGMNIVADNGNLNKEESLSVQKKKHKRKKFKKKKSPDTANEGEDPS